ncbi:MAG: ion transporter [Ignavibacteriales bacterium]|nr:ion transporter [Ignavibacteriales bacterium]
MNLFIGVIFYHFTAAQEAEGGKHSLFLTPEQERWLEIQKLVPTANPDYQFFMVPSHKINVFFYKIINYKYFDLIIMVCIVFNIVTMALSYETSSTSYNTILDNINYFFTAVFILECILKFLGLGFRGYLYSSWNKFDLFVVLTSIIDILMNNLGQSFLSFLRVGPQLARILRVMRVSRLLKLVKSLKGFNLFFI